jgi:hypothetical protein
MIRGPTGSTGSEGNLVGQTEGSLFDSRVTALRDENVGAPGADAGELTIGIHRDTLDEPGTGISHFSEFTPRQKGSAA